MVPSAGKGCGREMKLNKMQPHDETTVLASVLSMFLIMMTTGDSVDRALCLEYISNTCQSYKAPHLLFIFNKGGKALPQSLR